MTFPLDAPLPVSVVIPFFRANNTIQRAINSVAVQSLPPVEIIIVDDCSDDGSLEKLEELAETYAQGWIRVLSLPMNKGPGVARNAGWAAATQPYVAFLDADDTWHTKKLEIQYQWMSSNPEATVTGHPSARDESLTHNISSRLTAKKLKPFWLLFSNMFSSRSVMVRQDLPIRFDAEKRYMEDYWWLLKVVFSGYAVFKLNLSLAFTYKADYGESGLSKKLWEMEKAELDNYYRLKQAKLISPIFYLLLTLYSLAKYLKRQFVSLVRLLKLNFK
jgi:glycosyltransferase involved in cell wall biosynthesis